MSYVQYENNIQTAVLASEITNGTNNYADVTGLSLPMMASTTYEFEFEIIWRTDDASRGVRFSVNGPASPTSVLIYTEIPTTLSAVTVTMQRAYDTSSGTTSIDSANVNCYARCYGTVVNGTTAGNLILRFRRSGGGATIAIEPNSVMKMWRVNPSN